MLEIIAMALLCRRNAVKALSRGRKPTGFVLLTVALWAGPELLYTFIAMSLLPQNLDLMEVITRIYPPALLLAGIGAIISVIVANTCRRGDYIPPQSLPNLGPMPSAQAANAEQLRYAAPPANETWITNRSGIPVTVSGVQLFGPFSFDLAPGEMKRISQEARVNVFMKGADDTGAYSYALSRGEQWEVAQDSGILLMRKP